MEPIPVTGVMVYEGEMTGDGRTFAEGSLRWGADVLPIPIIFDRHEGDHSGATVGYIETVRRDGNAIRGDGYLSASDDPETQSLVNRAAELLAEGAVGVSVGVDAYRGEIRIDMSAFPDLDGEDGSIRFPVGYDDVTQVFTEARLRHLAIVDTPAFSQAALELAPTGALVASAGISREHFFANPKFGVPGSDDRLRYDPNNGKWSCPVTVEGDHVYGHVAPMGVCLRGQPGRCLTPPDGDLEGFMRAYAPAAGGLRTGVIQVGGSHADVGVGVVEASKHYDQTGKAVADVRVGRDAYGIWFAGMIRPGATEEMRYALAASDVSGHWEMNANGQPTLVGLPAVNVGGFPKGYLTHQEVTRGMAASAEIEDDDCGCEAHGEVIDLETVLSFIG